VLGFPAAAQASYSPAGAVAFIPGVREAAVDPASASAPRSCFRLEVDDDEEVFRPGVCRPVGGLRRLGWADK
jgi:hypothetical protein